MAGLNKVCLIGNLGADPEIRSMNSGDQVCNLSIATNETWKDRNGDRQERVEWHRVVCFNQHLIPVMQDYLRKGSKVYIEGKLQTRKWTDQSGQDKYTTEVVMQAFGSTLIMLDGRQDGDDRGGRGGYDGGRGTRGGRNDDRGGRDQRGFDYDDDRGGGDRGGGGFGRGRSDRDEYDRGSTSGGRDFGGSAFDSDLDDDVPF